MNLTTHFIKQPMPKNDFWAAIDSDNFDDEGGHIGYGKTEQAAIANLMGRMHATCEAVAEELIGRGFSDWEVAELMNRETA